MLKSKFLLLKQLNVRTFIAAATSYNCTTAAASAQTTHVQWVCARVCVFISARLTDEYMEIQAQNAVLFSQFIFCPTQNATFVPCAFCSKIHHFNFHLQLLYDAMFLLLLLFLLAIE